MKLTINQEIIYNTIMSDECAYANFQNFKLNTAINRAINITKKQGNLTILTNKEFKKLKKYLMCELHTEEK